jgi:protein-L-isoaspartate(D-aspartate) O-methyltransferase
METDFAAAQKALVEGLRQEIRDARVLEAMRRVPREKFVPEQYQRYAYDDRPLPIGHGQTISQPLMVAMMTEVLRLTGREKVLEVGTGSGYQAAILAQLAREVVTVERMMELADVAAQRLRELGYRNFSVYVNEKGLGWPPKAPYDAILVTAGAPQIPPALVDQLAIGGRLVIPVGGRRVQQLLRVVRQREGTTVTRHGQCRFVPLVGEGAWEEEDQGEY